MVSEAIQIFQKTIKGRPAGICMCLVAWMAALCSYICFTRFGGNPARFFAFPPPGPCNGSIERWCSLQPGMPDAIGWRGAVSFGEN